MNLIEFKINVIEKKICQVYEGRITKASYLRKQVFEMNLLLVLVIITADIHASPDADLPTVSRKAWKVS